MGKGLKTKGGRIMQWIRHGANPNLFEPNGLRVVNSNFEEYDYAEAIDFDKIRRQGAKALHANVPLEGMWMGSAKGALFYNLIDDQLLPYLVAKPMRDETVAGVRETEYRRAQFDRADREFFAVQEGIPTDCELGCFGLLTGFKWSSKRGNKGVSRFDLSFVTQTAVSFGAMTGGVPQNAVLTITTANVTTDGVFSVTRKGSASEVLTLHVNDSPATIKAAFEGLNAIDGATVTGGIAAVNEVQTLTAPGVAAVVLDAQAGGVAQTLNAGDTMAILGNKVAAIFGKTAGDVVVAGTSTAAIAAGFGVTGAGTAAVNGTYAAAGNFNAKPYYANTNGNGMLFWFNASGNWSFSTVLGANELYFKAAANPAPNPDGGVYQTLNGPAPVPVVVAQAAAASVLNLTFTFFGASVAAQNLPQLTSVTAGVTFATPTQGSAGGAVTVTITNPTNTPITITKTTGTGWSVTVTQPGSDGNIIGAIVDPLPVTPGHILLYRADTLAGLDLPGALVGKVQDWEYNDSKICQPQAHHNQVIDPARPDLPPTYDSYFEEETEEDSIVLTTTLDCDDSGDVPALLAMARATGGRYVSKVGYWRIVATCPIAPYLIKCEFYGSIGASIPRKFGGNVEQRTLVFDLIENREQPWALRWITRRPA